MTFEDVSGTRFRSFDDRLSHLEKQMELIEKAVRAIYAHLCQERDEISPVLEMLEKEDEQFITAE